MSKELNLVFEQVARYCAGLEMEGRAIVLGVNGLDAALNASFTKGLKAHLTPAGVEVAVFHLESCADTAARQEILAGSKGGVSSVRAQRFCEEGIDYTAARESIQEQTTENGVLVAEGVFLYTGALSDLFDLRVYLDAETPVVRARMEGAKSPAAEQGNLDFFDALTAPAFEYYVGEYNPATAADLVVDVNDLRRPRVVAAAG